MEEAEMVTPGEVLGRATELKAGKGACVAPHNKTIHASLTGFCHIQSPPRDSLDQRPTVEVTGHTAHGAVPEPGSVVIARTLRRGCIDRRSIYFNRQQDVRVTEIDKVDMHL